MNVFLMSPVLVVFLDKIKSRATGIEWQIEWQTNLFQLSQFPNLVAPPPTASLLTEIKVTNVTLIINLKQKALFV